MFGLQHYQPARMSPRSLIDLWFDPRPRLPSAVVGELWNGHYGAADLYQTNDAVIVQMTMPGFTGEDISVQEQQSVLTIHAEQRAEQRGERDGVHFEARRAHCVRRSFRLPVDVDVERADATLRNGVLTVTLPKAQTSRAHRIAIQTPERTVKVRGSARSWWERLTGWLRCPSARLTREAA